MRFWTKKKPGEFPADVIDYLHDIFAVLEGIESELRRIANNQERGKS